MPQRGQKQEPHMIFSSAFNAIRTTFEKHQRYARMAAEIEALSSADLADIRGDRAEMLFQAWQEVYG